MDKYRYLYIFPHPDDESFGPAGVMHKQCRTGNDVCLLTLTRGGATKQRHKFGYSIDEMGEVRYKEMLKMSRVLGLAELTVLDLPDSGLKELNPVTIETILLKQIDRIRPDIIVTYPVHGISGFHDHLVTHAVVKRAFCRMRSEGALWLRRLAFFTLPLSPELKEFHFPLHGSTPEEIDCVIEVDHDDVLAQREALACYKTYAETIADTDIINKVRHLHHFEIFGESFSTPITDLAERLPHLL